MTNDERMTGSKNRKLYAEDPFRKRRLETVVREKPEANRVYDLEERTTRFGEAVVDPAMAIPQNHVASRMINQLVAAATSVGANYAEPEDDYRMNAIRHSCFVINSSFAIRHFNYAR